VNNEGVRADLSNEGPRPRDGEHENGEMPISDVNYNLNYSYSQKLSI